MVGRHKVFARGRAHTILSPHPCPSPVGRGLSPHFPAPPLHFADPARRSPCAPASQAHPPHFVCGGEAPFGRLGASPPASPRRNVQTLRGEAPWRQLRCRPAHFVRGGEAPFARLGASPPLTAPPLHYQLIPPPFLCLARRSANEEPPSLFATVLLCCSSTFSLPRSSLGKRGAPRLTNLKTCVWILINFTYESVKYLYFLGSGAVGIFDCLMNNNFFNERIEHFSRQFRGFGVLLD